MDAHSPGTSVVKVVNHQVLNKRILVALIVASTFLGFIILCIVIGFCFYRFRNLKNSKNKRKHSSESFANKVSLEERFSGLNDTVSIIEYHLLESATQNFHDGNILAEGGRGNVYRARFDEKSLAAVKMLEGGSQDTEREFENELSWLVKIRHQNIISLSGYCIYGDRRLLVYEMMQNGSLQSQLHGSTRGSALTWPLRLKIAVDVARGLEYLHEHCNPSIIHRDLRSSNILLGSNFNAKISDFGIAVSAGGQTKTIKLSGTLDYVAPEYLLEGKLTDKSDVYAFGVVLLELLTGRKPVEKMSPSHCQSVVTWAMPQLTDRSRLTNIVDTVIKDTMDLKHLYQVAAVAVLCVQPEPSYRPLITDVLHSLIPLLPLELGGSLRVSL